jgi:GNAT superfamily N-acetyltransferase
MSDRHPDHDGVAAAIRSGFTESYPAMGYVVERRRFGYYQRHGAGFGAVLVTDARPEVVSALLDDVRRYYGDHSAGIYTEGDAADALLGPALMAAGCLASAIQVHLAHVGDAPSVRPVPGLTLEPATDETIVDWSRVKLQGFANSEEEPDPERMRFEVALRRAEMAGEGRFTLARLDGEPAAIIGCYDAGADLTVFHLATRVPFRDRGIARYLLTRQIAEAYEEGHRAIMIGCDPDDTPIQLYRRLGFRDQVHWRRRYELPPAGA